MLGCASDKQQRHDAYHARMPASISGTAPSDGRVCASGPDACAPASSANQASTFATYGDRFFANVSRQPAEQKPYSRSGYSIVRPCSRAYASSTNMSQIGCRIFPSDISVSASSATRKLEHVTELSQNLALLPLFERAEAAT